MSPVEVVTIDIYVSTYLHMKITITIVLQLYNFTTLQLYNFTTLQLYNFTILQFYNFPCIGRGEFDNCHGRSPAAYSKERSPNSSSWKPRSGILRVL